MNKVAEKADLAITLGKKSDNTYAEKGNEGMKVNCNFCGYTNMRKAERNVLLGARHVTVVKVEIIMISPNARRYMKCPSSKMVMTIMMTSCTWL